MSDRRQWTAAAAIVVIWCAGAGANLLFTAHYVHSTQAAQQRQGVAVERKLCATLGGVAALQPPTGNPATNPSRAYDQRLHAKLSQLATDIGCGGPHG